MTMPNELIADWIGQIHEFDQMSQQAKRAYKRYGYIDRHQKPAVFASPRDASSAEGRESHGNAAGGLSCVE